MQIKETVHVILCTCFDGRYGVVSSYAIASSGLIFAAHHVAEGCAPSQRTVLSIRIFSPSSSFRIFCSSTLLCAWLYTHSSHRTITPLQVRLRLHNVANSHEIRLHWMTGVPDSLNDALCEYNQQWYRHSLQ